MPEQREHLRLPSLQADAFGEYKASMNTLEEYARQYPAIPEATRHRLSTKLSVRGPQYRSAIFYMDDSQKKIAEAYIAQLNKAKAYSKPIVTRVDPYKAFYWAEPEHQDFLVHNPNNPYIVTHDLPKIANLRKVFPAIYNNTPIPFDGLR
jgi:peptide methionine sulfoxide reductase MsrA